MERVLGVLPEDGRENLEALEARLGTVRNCNAYKEGVRSYRLTIRRMIYRNARYRVDRVHAANYIAEHRVLSVELATVVGQIDEKLGGRTPEIATHSCHRKVACVVVKRSDILKWDSLRTLA